MLTHCLSIYKLDINIISMVNFPGIAKLRCQIWRSQQLWVANKPSILTRSVAIFIAIFTPIGQYLTDFVMQYLRIANQRLTVILQVKFTIL
ncbi:hypothetical protein NIES2098_71710 [Calothrix sp. NIES-2098]|nr:hypothetical protein NIES2098_71710 [Calothrix sp. NIES-2098]